jgi:hypothetical protein
MSSSLLELSPPSSMAPAPAAERIPRSSSSSNTTDPVSKPTRIPQPTSPGFRARSPIPPTSPTGSASSDTSARANRGKRGGRGGGGGGAATGSGGRVVNATPPTRGARGRGRGGRGKPAAAAQSPVSKSKIDFSTTSSKPSTPQAKPTTTAEVQILTPDQLEALLPPSSMNYSQLPSSSYSPPFSAQNPSFQSAVPPLVEPIPLKKGFLKSNFDALPPSAAGSFKEASAAAASQPLPSQEPPRRQADEELFDRLLRTVSSDHHELEASSDFLHAPQSPPRSQSPSSSANQSSQEPPPAEEHKEVDRQSSTQVVSPGGLPAFAAAGQGQASPVTEESRVGEEDSVGKEGEEPVGGWNPSSPKPYSSFSLLPQYGVDEVLERALSLGADEDEPPLFSAVDERAKTDEEGKGGSTEASGDEVVKKDEKEEEELVEPVRALPDPALEEERRPTAPADGTAGGSSPDASSAAAPGPDLSKKEVEEEVVESLVVAAPDPTLEEAPTTIEPERRSPSPVQSGSGTLENGTRPIIEDSQHPEAPASSSSTLAVGGSLGGDEPIEARETVDQEAVEQTIQRTDEARTSDSVDDDGIVNLSTGLPLDSAPVSSSPEDSTNKETTLSAATLQSNGGPMTSSTSVPFDSSDDSDEDERDEDDRSREPQRPPEFSLTRALFNPDVPLRRRVLAVLASVGINLALPFVNGVMLGSFRVNHRTASPPPLFCMPIKINVCTLCNIGLGEIFAREWLAVYFNIGPFAQEARRRAAERGDGSFASSNVGLRGAGAGGSRGAERKPSAAGAKTAVESVESGVGQVIRESTR